MILIFSLFYHSLSSSQTNERLRILENEKKNIESQIIIINKKRLELTFKASQTRDPQLLAIYQTEDKKLEFELKALETRLQAINTEIESIKKLLQPPSKPSFKF